MCLDSGAKKTDMLKPVGLYPCHNQGGNQVNLSKLFMTIQTSHRVFISLFGRISNSFILYFLSFSSRKPVNCFSIISAIHNCFLLIIFHTILSLLTALSTCFNWPALPVLVALLITAIIIIIFLLLLFAIVLLTISWLFSTQFWLLSKNGEIRRDDACLDYSGSDVILYPCHGAKGNQNWSYDHQVSLLPSCMTVLQIWLIVVLICMLFFIVPPNICYRFSEPKTI